MCKTKTTAEAEWKSCHTPFLLSNLEARAGAHLNMESFLGGTRGASAVLFEEILQLLQTLNLKRAFSTGCSYPDHPVIPQVSFICSPSPRHHIIKYLLIWFCLLISKPWGFFICITNHLEGLFAIWLMCTLHFLFFKGCGGYVHRSQALSPGETNPGCFGYSRSSSTTSGQVVQLRDTDRTRHQTHTHSSELTALKPILAV